MNRTASILVLSGALLGGCVVHQHDDHDVPPPHQSGGGEASKHPHGGPPGQTGEHPHGGPPGQTKKQQVVVVETTHVCVATCVHFYFEGVWYVEEGHKHGDGCGHILAEGKWGDAKGKDKDKGPKDKDKDKDKDKGKKDK